VLLTTPPTDLAETCIPAPFESELPTSQFQDENRREEVRDWVLAMSMDQSVEQSLPTREDRSGASIYDVLYTSKNSPCIVTGYPIPPTAVLEMNSTTANKQDWNKFVSKSKNDPWTGQPQNPVY
jgi:intraflagellar transport protein 172